MARSCIRWWCHRNVQRTNHGLLGHGKASTFCAECRWNLCRVLKQKVIHFKETTLCWQEFLLVYLGPMRTAMCVWTVVCQAPLSMEFSRQEYCSGLPFPSSRDHLWPRDWWPSSCIAGSYFTTKKHIDSVQFSCSVVSDSLGPHELQHARPPCPSPNPRVYSNSCPSSRWCHPAISSSVVPSPIDSI